MKLTLFFIAAIAFAQDKPAAPAAKTPEAKTPEIKMVSKDRQIALLKARSESAEPPACLILEIANTGEEKECHFRFTAETTGKEPLSQAYAFTSLVGLRRPSGSAIQRS